METFYMLVLGQELVSFFSQNTIESLTHVGFKIFHVVHEILRHLGSSIILICQEKLKCSKSINWYINRDIISVKTNISRNRWYMISKSHNETSRKDDQSWLFSLT